MEESSVDVKNGVGESYRGFGSATQRVMDQNANFPHTTKKFKLVRK